MRESHSNRHDALTGNRGRTIADGGPTRAEATSSQPPAWVHDLSEQQRETLAYNLRMILRPKDALDDIIAGRDDRIERRPA